MRITEERIRAAAEATLESWPAATAVLLFGSRARGDHRPTSDWDVAMVSDKGQDCPDGLPLSDLVALVPPVLGLTGISDASIRHNCNHLGELGCALAREARPIAGHWRPPDGLREPRPDPERFRRGVRHALRSCSDGLEASFFGFLNSTAAAAQQSANDFADSSERCARHLVRMMLIRSCRARSTRFLRLIEYSSDRFSVPRAFGMLRASQDRRFSAFSLICAMATFCALSCRPVGGTQMFLPFRLSSTWRRGERSFDARP